MAKDISYVFSDNKMDSVRHLFENLRSWEMSFGLKAKLKTKLIIKNVSNVCAYSHFIRVK